MKSIFGLAQKTNIGCYKKEDVQFFSQTSEKMMWSIISTTQIWKILQIDTTNHITSQQKTKKKTTEKNIQFSF